MQEITNPFYDKLYPDCLEREAGYNRGCYSGFEEARNVFESKIEEAKARALEAGKLLGAKQERAEITQYLKDNGYEDAISWED